MAQPQTKREAYEKAVLAYFNRCLLDQGLITKQEFQSMHVKIRQMEQTRL